MLLSDYDRQNTQTILNDKRADWFTAILMKYLSHLTIDERSPWASEFRDVVDAVYGKMPPKERTSLTHVFWKADPDNRRKIARVLRRLADTIDPDTETPQ